MSRLSMDRDWNRDFAGRYSDPVTVEKASALVVEIQDQVANLIASAIDAGSERDAVNEDEELEEAIQTLVEGWIQVK